MDTQRNDVDIERMRAAKTAMERQASTAEVAAILAGRIYEPPPVFTPRPYEPRYRSPVDAETASPSTVSPSIVDVEMLNCTESLTPDIDGCGGCLGADLPPNTYAWTVPCSRTLVLRLADGTEIRFAHSEWASIAITPPKDLVASTAPTFKDRDGDVWIRGASDDEVIYLNSNDSNHAVRWRREELEVGGQPAYGTNNVVDAFNTLWPR